MKAKVPVIQLGSVLGDTPRTLAALGYTCAECAALGSNRSKFRFVRRRLMPKAGIVGSSCSYLVAGTKIDPHTAEFITT